MKITKLGHCCLVIEVKGAKIVTDPGAWNDLPSNMTGITAVLLTHEHSDHLHIDSLKQILRQSPQAKVVTNSAVGRLLDSEGIRYEIVEHGELLEIDEVEIAGFGERHAEIYPSITAVQNTGYMIDSRMFYPGDNLYNPQLAIEVLALPVAGPWLKLADAINYAKEVQPKFCFPVHDGMFRHLGSFHSLPETELKQEGILFKPMSAGESWVVPSSLRLEEQELPETND
jgi:L-ascorbate metabolism protein UlaG (beta-lactamase superfamily)